MNSINISYLKKVDNVDKSSKKTKRNIVVNNFFCENNIFICDKIRDSIPNYSDKFEILTSAISLFTSDQKKEENEKDLYLLEYENNEEDLTSFFELKNDQKIVIHTYQKLLRHLLLLQKANIVHFNINYETICFDKKHRVLLRDWSNAISTSTSTTIPSILSINTTITTNSPLEIYVLSHIKKDKKANTLNRESIESICKTYVDNPYLSFITSSSKDKLYSKSLDFIMPLIDMPREKIIHEMMKYSHTWDNYSLTIIYLHIIASFKHKSAFFLDLFRLLNKILLTKADIPETIDAFDSLLFRFARMAI